MTGTLKTGMLAVLLYSQATAAHGCIAVGWERYRPIQELSGLHTKPIEIDYGEKRVRVNGVITSDDEAIKLVQESQSLFPKPIVVLTIEKRSLSRAQRFAKRVSGLGLCGRGKCFYRVRGKR